MRNFLITIFVSFTLLTNAQAELKLIWANSSWGDAIGMSDLNGSNVNQTYFSSGSPTDVEYEPISDYFYYVSQDYARISRASADGLTITDTYIDLTGVFSVDCLSLYNNKIYFTTGLANIGVVDLDGNNINTTLITGQSAFGAIHVTNSYIYFASGGRYIKRANLDGTNITQIYDHGASASIRRMYVDITNNYIFFSDYFNDGFVRIDITGINPITINSVTDAYGIYVDEVNDLVYMGRNNNTNAIQRCNLDGSSLISLVATANHPWSLEIANVEIIVLPTITSATYNSSTGALVVTGTNLEANAGDDIDATKFTITGQGGATYTLTAATSNVEISSATEFTLTIAGADKTAVDALLNQNGTSSVGGTTYNLAAAADWCTNVAGAADLTGNGIRVGNYGFSLSWVNVGNAGNTADPATTFGAVSDEYSIMQFEFTNSQYVSFLNAIDPDGTNPNSVYKAEMGTNDAGGISFSAGASVGSKYAIRTNMGNKPVNYNCWWDVARVCNWLHNGAPIYSSSNALGTAPHNQGAYNIGTSTSGFAVTKETGALYWIPTENQWYKAAYYNGNTDSYSTYGNGYSTNPGTITANASGDGSAGSTGNFANYSNTTSWGSPVRYFTSVGTNGSANFYGAYDMSGNAWEINDNTGVGGNPDGTHRNFRGGDYSTNNVVNISKAYTFTNQGTTRDFVADGFRLASDPIAPSINSATYNATTGDLVVSGIGFISNAGDDDINATQFTITGQGGATYTLTAATSNVEITSGLSFTLTIAGADKTAVDALLNKNGTSSVGGTNYNLAVAANWCTNYIGGADLTGNAIIVSNVPDLPTVTTASAGTIATTSATFGGNVTSDGGASVSERGIVYSTTDASPEIGEAGVTKDDNGSGTGAFSESISGLTAGTLYYVRAYAINSQGTSYGTKVDVKTLPNQATNVSFSNIAANTFTISWTRGNGDGVAVFLKQTDEGSASPVNGTGYSDNTAFASGDQIGGTGWYCVYDGTGTTVDVTDVNNTLNLYTVHVVEYVNFTGNNYRYNTASTTSTAISVSTPTSQASDITFSNVSRSSMTVSWTKGDGDGSLLLAKEQYRIASSPLSDGVVYAGASTNYTSAPTVGGAKMLYNGTDANPSINVTGLTRYKMYYFRAFAYNNVSSPYYLQSENSTNPRSRWTLRRDALMEEDLSIDAEFPYPNPVSNTITTTLDLFEEGRISAKIYDIDGKMISELYNQALPFGTHQLTFDLSNIPSGVYQIVISKGSEAVVYPISVVR